MSRYPLRNRVNSVTSSPAYRLVIIDDDPGVLNGLTLFFKQDYEVQAHQTAERGINSIDDETAAVILDIKMPGVDGFTARARIAASYPSLPVIFYSAFQNILETNELMHKHKPFAFVEKGKDPKELQTAVTKAVAHHQRVSKLRGARDELRSLVSSD